jgi:hypothetical protein
MIWAYWRQRSADVGLPSPSTARSAPPAQPRGSVSSNALPDPDQYRAGTAPTTDLIGSGSVSPLRLTGLESGLLLLFCRPGSTMARSIAFTASGKSRRSGRHSQPSHGNIGCTPPALIGWKRLRLTPMSEWAPPCDIAHARVGPAPRHCPCQSGPRPAPLPVSEWAPPCATAHV